MKRERASERGGFTLVEVLLTTMLAAVLLTALWSLLSMYSKVFESGHARTEQSQLARTLLEQISTDLQGVLRAPPPAPSLPIFSSPSSGSSRVGGSSTRSSSSESSSDSRTVASASTPSAPPLGSAPHGASSPLPGGTMPVAGSLATSRLRPAGLFGTATFLQIDVLQPAVVEPETEFEEPASFDESESSKAEELKTVIYSFEKLHDPDRPLGERVMHLVRREMNWAHAQAQAAEGSAGRLDQRDSSYVAAQSELVAESPDPTESIDREELAAEDLVVSVPEVLRFSMRYFDGTDWSDEWDSIARRGLPVAVEVTVQLRSHDEPDPLSGDVVAEAGVDDERVLQWKHPVHRLLIPLAMAGREPGASSSPLGEAPFGVEVPLGATSNGGFGQQ